MMNSYMNYGTSLREITYALLEFKYRKKGKERISKVIKENSQKWGDNWISDFIKLIGHTKISIQNYLLIHIMIKLSKIKEREF